MLAKDICSDILSYTENKQFANIESTFSKNNAKSCGLFTKSFNQTNFP